MTARRLIAALVLVAVIASGLFVHALPNSAATDIAGDALYALAAYALMVVVAPRLRPVPVAAIAAGWCFAIEFLQLTSLPQAAADILPMSRLVLGSGFDARDLLVYALAALAAGLVDAALTRVVRSRRAVPPPR